MAVCWFIWPSLKDGHGHLLSFGMEDVGQTLFAESYRNKIKMDNKSWHFPAFPNGSAEAAFHVISVNYLGNNILYEANQTKTLFSCVSQHGIPADYKN